MGTIMQQADQRKMQKKAPGSESSMENDEKTWYEVLETDILVD